MQKACFEEKGTHQPVRPGGGLTDKKLSLKEEDTKNRERQPFSNPSKRGEPELSSTGITWEDERRKSENVPLVSTETRETGDKQKKNTVLRASQAAHAKRIVGTTE